MEHKIPVKHSLFVHSFTRIKPLFIKEMKNHVISQSFLTQPRPQRPSQLPAENLIPIFFPFFRGKINIPDFWRSKMLLQEMEGKQGAHFNRRRRRGTADKSPMLMWSSTRALSAGYRCISFASQRDRSCCCNSTLASGARVCARLVQRYCWFFVLLEFSFSFLS